MKWTILEKVSFSNRKLNDQNIFITPCILADEQHQQYLMQIVAHDIEEFKLVFLMGCYHFR